MSRQGGPRIKLSPKVSPRGSPRVVSPVQGPMRATLPLSVVCKEEPHQDFWRGRRSPGARIYGGTQRREPPAAPMRRSASLDNMYRFWGRSFPVDGIFPCKNRATQTDSYLSSSLRTESLTDELRRLFTARTQRTLCMWAIVRLFLVCLRALFSAPGSNTSRSGSTLPHGSEEGLNQEIESYTGIPAPSVTQEPIPEGRRAPVLDLLRETALLDFRHNRHASDDSADSDPDSETRFAAQKLNYPAALPPQDCEFLSRTNVTRTLVPIPVKLTPSKFFNLQPSSHSAFESLPPKDDDEEEGEAEDKSPKVPHQD